MIEFFLAERGRLRALGKVVTHFGFLWVTCGAFGRLAVWAANGIDAGGHAMEEGLADLFPGVPTWWVPESAMGLLPAAALILLGVWASLCGRQFDELHRHDHASQL